MKPTISVIIPALNEEANIAATVQEVTGTLSQRVADYELLLFNDGSTDHTGQIMERLAAGNPRIRVIHNQRPNNLGGVYKQGLALARYEYLLMVPGDNENPRSALIPVLDAIGRADIIIPYPTNPHVRPWSRRVGSRGYTGLVNLLFGQRLKYYNGTVISRTADLRSINISTNSFAYQSESLLRLLRNGHSYYEVGIEIHPQPGRQSKALRLGNLWNVLKAVIHLVIEIRFRKSRSSP